jgi:GrpB-like predicted nucleotidyltransferase (UPF0157 family)
MGLKNNTVYLENNYLLWKKMFEDEKIKLMNIFNQDNLIIEHIGSTSIKNLKSKPIVDILIGINSIEQINKYLNTLKEIYTIKENKEKEEILLIKENKNETFFLIHVLNINSNRYKNILKFRNILNNNQDIVKEYEKVKEELANKYPNNRELYTKSKNDFIKHVINNN